MKLSHSFLAKNTMKPSPLPISSYAYQVYLNLVRCTDSRDCKSLANQNEKWFCSFTKNRKEKGYCNKCESPSISFPNPCEMTAMTLSDFWEKSRTIEECKLHCPGHLLLPSIYYVRCVAIKIQIILFKIYRFILIQHSLFKNSHAYCTNSSKW